MDESKPETTPEAPNEPMSWLQLIAEAQRTLKATLGDPLPAEFRRHLQTSHKEGLLAVRSLLDAQLERLDRQEEQAKDRKVTRITIQ